MKKKDRTELEFEYFIRNVVKNIEKENISLYQFMVLARNNNIKFYSRDQMSKIASIFQNHGTSIYKSIPFSYLQLVSIQIAYNIKYFIVRINKQSRLIPMYYGQNNIEHDGKKCLKILRKIMYRLYGNQMNWFKVLGGLTISVKINCQIFKKNINKILKNTCHSQCSSKILQQFIQSNQKQIDWCVFMTVIKSSRINTAKSQKSNNSIDHNSTNKNWRITNKQQSQQKSKKTTTTSLDFRKCTLHPRQDLIINTTKYILSKSTNIKQHLSIKRKIISFSKTNCHSKTQNSFIN